MRLYAPPHGLVLVLLPHEHRKRQALHHSERSLPRQRGRGAPGQKLAAHLLQKGLCNAALACGRRDVSDLSRPLLLQRRRKEAQPHGFSAQHRLVRASRLAAQRARRDHQHRLFYGRPQGHHPKARLPAKTGRELHLSQSHRRGLLQSPLRHRQLCQDRPDPRHGRRLP